MSNISTINYVFSKIMLFSPLIFLIFLEDYFLIWMMMELSLFGLVTVFNNSAIRNKEKLLYYFILQIASGFLILWSCNFNNQSMNYLFFFGILIKLALMPSSWWYFLIMKMNNLFILFILTLQKLFYLIFLTHTLMNKWFFHVVLVSMIINIFTLAQNSVIDLVILSSIYNNIWIIISLLISNSLFWLYISLYWVSLLMLFMQWGGGHLMNEKQLDLSKIWLILSVSGLPPFILFWPKIMILISLKTLSLLMICILLSSIFNLMTYLRLMGFMMLMNMKTLYSNKTFFFNCFVGSGVIFLL